MMTFSSVFVVLLILQVALALPPPLTHDLDESLASTNNERWWPVAAAIAGGAAWVYDRQTCLVPLGAEGRCLKKCKDLGRCYGACDWPACICVTRKAGCPSDSSVCKRQCPN